MTQVFYSFCFVLSVLTWFLPTDAFDLSDDSSPGDGQKGRSGKQSDRSKDTGSGLKKIFSGPKKVNEHVPPVLKSPFIYFQFKERKRKYYFLFLWPVCS